MKILVTGGAGFIGRWVVERLLSGGHDVFVLDNLSNGRRENLAEFAGNRLFHGLVEEDIRNKEALERLFDERFQICFHLGASINVQDSLDDPETTFVNDVVGTFNVLEASRRTGTKLVFMSTCMVYDRCAHERGIDELHPVKPASPYAGSKLAAEHMVLSYFYGYSLPVVILRPFNTYGPFQKTGGEGGVVAIFTKRSLMGLPVNVYGSGTQTRDLLYVKDCADFVVRAAFCDSAVGQVINAGTGRDVTINDLARMIAADERLIQHVPHIHPQSEIPVLRCNYSKAKELLDWKPRYSLEEGLEETRQWIASNPELV